jgi:hypothetical protein
VKERIDGEWQCRMAPRREPNPFSQGGRATLGDFFWRIAARYGRRVPVIDLTDEEPEAVAAALRRGRPISEGASALAAACCAGEARPGHDGNGAAECTATEGRAHAR